MSFLFGKKPAVYALATVLEDGYAMMSQELKKAKYNEYRGKEAMLEIRVRVEPDNEAPFECKMKAGMGKTHLLKPGAKVKVKYEQGNQNQVELDDEIQAILARNPQLGKKL